MTVVSRPWMHYSVSRVAAVVISIEWMALVLPEHVLDILWASRSITRYSGPDPYAGAGLP